MPVSRESVLWAHRLLRGSEPESESEIQELMQLETEVRLVRSLIDLRAIAETDRIAPNPPSPPAEGPPGEFSREAVLWAYRLLLGREPESEAVLGAKMRARDRHHLLDIFLSSREFMQRARSWPKRRPVPTASGRRSLDIPDLPDDCIRGESVGKIRGVVTYPGDQEDDLGNLRLHHHGTTPAEAISGVQIELWSIPRLTVCISDSGQAVRVGKANTGVWTLRMWGQSSVEIGDDCTSNGTLCWVTWGGRLRIGRDCMFADFIEIHVGDNHAIFDVSTLATTNYRPNPTVIIGDHVWLASRATVLADAVIGSGSIVGSQAVLKGEIPECSLAAGLPARVTRSSVSWTRSHDGSGASEVVERFNLRKSQGTPAD
ncbi:MAG TPA: acyltransferase [Steroidobacteraceae bacterium]|nr:acyltransferase [Steroidobacteraceae bacterium]